MMISDEAKFNKLSNLITEGAERPLTEQETRYIKWLCGWDMETFNTFKGLFQSLSDKR